MCIVLWVTSTQYLYLISQLIYSFPNWFKFKLIKVNLDSKAVGVDLQRAWNIAVERKLKIHLVNVNIPTFFWWT